jgi:hypothetical protein
MNIESFDLKVPFLKREFTETMSLKDIKNKQNYMLYEKAGSKNKEVVNKIIMTYDWNNSILEVVNKYYNTPDLKKAIQKFFMEREIFLNNIIEKL